MFDACKMFVDERGADIFGKNLVYNFLLHLENLYDYGFLDGAQKKDILLQLHGLKNNEQPKPLTNGERNEAIDKNASDESHDSSRDSLER